MNKSVRNFAFAATLFLSASPIFANMMGTNPHPAVVALSLGDIASIVLTIAGL